MKNFGSTTLQIRIYLRNDFSPLFTVIKVITCRKIAMIENLVILSFKFITMRMRICIVIRKKAITCYKPKCCPFIRLQFVCVSDSGLMQRPSHPPPPVLYLLNFPRDNGSMEFILQHPFLVKNLM
jgi:hypothetical protein